MGQTVNGRKHYKVEERNQYMVEIKCVKSIKEIDGQREKYMNNLIIHQRKH